MNQESKRIIKTKMNTLRATENQQQTKRSRSQKKKSDNSKNLNESYKWSQDFVNVKQINSGLVFSKDGKVFKTLEILPVNFYQRSNLEKNFLTDSYTNFFRISPRNLHFKMRTEKTNIATLIRNINKSLRTEKNVEIKKRAEEYIQHITSLQTEDTIARRYYITFSYEGDYEGKYSKDINEIYTAMRETEMHIRSVFTSMGNIVLSFNDIQEETRHQAEIYYKFYNPLSMYDEELIERIERINSDIQKFNANLPENLQLKADDSVYLAPRGINTQGRSWILMDGQYHTFISIRDDSFPLKTYTGWLDAIPSEYGVDIDMFTKKLNHELVLEGLRQNSKFKKTSYNANWTNPEKAEELARDYQNSEYIKECIKNGDEDLFDTCIIITIRANTYKEMILKRNALVKKLQSKSIYTSPSFLSATRYLRSVTPDMYIDNSIFKKNKRNLMTRNLGQTYFYTSYELFDDTGFVMGSNALGESLLAMNNFDTSRYSNGNIVILGTSGAGKSYTEMMLGARMRIMGIRTMFVLPLKGHEYLGLCNSLGGEYIKLIPGGSACLNIMQIRPQEEIDKSKLSDDTTIISSSLLAKKITSLATFVQLNMQDDKLSATEKTRFSTLCTRLYKRYNITEDNDSIWLDKKNKILKPMPILQDLSDALYQEPELARIKDVLLPYTEGIASNMNGQTNVNLNNKCLVFDINKLEISEDLLPAFMFIAYDCCYDLAKESLMKKDAIFMDEVWYMMGHPACAKQVKEMVKIIRGYGACTVLATQDINDFLSAADGFGASVLASTELKFILRMKEEEIYKVANILRFNNTDIKRLKEFPPHGRGMVMSGQDKIIIDFLATSKEDEFYTTDVNKRAYYNQQKLNAAQQEMQ